ncbi:hypothetical protein [Deinococcus maricopensis]|uniref:hypothetical protein n=1 Tax=Deinococcus maricopensis TaxID=309887 RepID=UPI0011D22AD6|nr:hypothetical protein [Deinococcus maricopensis]
MMSIVGGAVALFLALLALAFFILRSPPPPRLAFEQSSCTPSAEWNPVFLSEPGALRRMADGWFVEGASALGTHVCQGGTLVVDMQPDGGPGAPALTVLLDGQQLGRYFAPTRRTVTIEVPHAGALQLAYLNDYYRADVRSVEIREVRTNVLGCQLLTPAKPLSDPQNVYVPQSDLLALFQPEPVAYQACGAGALSFRMMGHPGNGSFPIVEARQEGKTLAKFTASAEWRVFKVPVRAGLVTLQFINPYARETEDRNLVLNRVSWTPR